MSLERPFHNTADRTAYYRAMEQECLHAAQSCADAVHAEQFKNIARGWADLAEQEEGKSSPNRL